MRHKQRFYVYGLEAIGPVAELAGHGHGALLLEHPAHLLGPERPKEACHATLTAAALETHRRASEQSHVLVGEALPEQLFHRAPEQLRHAEALDPPLRAFPGGRNFLEVPLGSGSRELLHEHSATARPRKSCVHCATRSFSAPFPSSWNVSVPRNFSVAASSTDATTASPRSPVTSGG